METRKLNIKISSFKSSGNIQKKKGGPNFLDSYKGRG